VDPGMLLLSETGFSPYRVWYTSRDFIRQNPAAVRAFTAASIRGWREYIDGDRREADAMIRSLNQHITPEFIDYCVAAMKDNKLIAGDPDQGETTGQINPARLAQELRQLNDIGMFTQPMKVEDVFDGQFLPAEVQAKTRTP